MYHALVRTKAGHWVSYGIHCPSTQWTEFFQTLVRAYGEQSVGSLFWNPDDDAMDPYAMRQRAETEVDTANQAQRQQDAGRLPTEEDGKPVGIARLVASLRDQHAAGKDRS